MTRECRPVEWSRCGAVGKDTVSRAEREVKTDWDAWSARSLADEPIVRLILDGTVVRVRLDRKATSISLLVAIGVREDGQKILLPIKSVDGESGPGAILKEHRPRGSMATRNPDAPGRSTRASWRCRSPAVFVTAIMSNLSRLDHV